jgi:hypothetical protein
VRDLPVTPAGMHATMELFVNLAEGTLIHVDMCRAEFRDYLRDPVAQFPLTLAEGLAGTYAEQIEAVDLDRGLIWDPAPMVFGLDRNPDTTEPTIYPLALAIWKLLSQTSLATVRENRPGAFAAMVPSGPLRDAITAISPLPEGTDVQGLADELDVCKPNGVKGLGTTLLYVAGMTGNQYADTTHDELMDSYANYGLDWEDIVLLAEVKEAQEEALTIARQFHGLNDGFLKKPKRYVTLFRTVQRVAAELRKRRVAPKTLMEIYAPDPPREDPYGHVYHPIDISRDIETDDIRGIDLLGPVYVLSATGPLGGGPPALHHPDGDAAPAPGGGHPAR